MTQIEHPDYYRANGYEAADFIDAHGLNFNRGNIVKYVVRAGKNDGENALTALLKARWYLDREIALAGNEQRAELSRHKSTEPLECSEEKTIFDV